MKTLKILMLLLVTISANLFAQRTIQFGKFTDKDGYPVKGTSFERGFEKQIIVNSYSVSNGNSVTITIPNSPAVNAFQSIVNSKFALQNGEIAVVQIQAERKAVSQKIQMTAIKVMSVQLGDEIATIVLEPATLDNVYTGMNGNTR